MSAGTDPRGGSTMTTTASATSRSATDVAGRRARPLARADGPLPRRPDDRAGRDDRERRPAVDPRRPRLLGDLARVGGQRLPADLRRLPAAGRPARRPLRPEADVPDRHRPLHRRVGRVRPVGHPGAARRLAGGAGARRRAGVRGGALAAHDAVHGARRPGQGDGHLRLRALGRRRGRRAARRRADRPPELALDLPRQRPGRRPGLPAVAAPAPVHAAPRPRAAASTSPAP